ncbi:MAG: pilus assembly protein HicB [Bacteroidales bacterium]|nr:pilus assembly protein HicB [Bacteroidales bacterium]
MNVTGIIERNDNGYYQISSEEEIGPHGLGGYGYSVAEAKGDFLKSIEEAKDMIVEETGELSAQFEDIEVDFRYDIPSFFNYFDWINVSAFAKKAGINESKMRAYKSGLATASEKTMERICATIKAIGAELSSATL